MTLDPRINFGKVTLLIGIDDTVTTITLTVGHGNRLPSTHNYNLPIWNATDYPDPADAFHAAKAEIVRVTNRVNDVLTVLRAQEGTVARDHNTAGKTYNMILAATKKTLDDIDTAVDANTTKLAGIESGATADQTGAEIKTLYEGEPNAYTDTKNTKLAGIETGAQVTNAANIANAGAITIDSQAANTAPILTLGNTADDIAVYRVDASPEGAVTANIGDLAVGNEGMEGTVWVKHTGNGTDTGWEGLRVSHYTDMHLHDNAVATQIDTVNIPHLMQGVFSEELTKGFAFAAGSNGSISAFADYGGTVPGTVKATSTAHGLATGAILSQSGTTNYNGVYVITVIDSDNYYFTDIWAGNDGAGNWYKGDSVTANAGTAGVYGLMFSGFGTSAVNNKTFEFEIFKKANAQENVESMRRFSSSDIGSVAGTGLLVIADGDVITIGIIGITDTTNFTVQHMDVSLFRV